MGKRMRALIWFFLMLLGYTFIYSGLSYLKAPWIASPAAGSGT